MESPESIATGTPVFGVNGEAIGLVEATEDESFRLRGHVVPRTAIARVDNAGIHLHLARAAFEATSSLSQEERIAVPLAEERLVVGTRQVQHGEVVVEKRVVEEQVMVPVIVRREEIEIIRRAPGEPRTEVDDPSIVEVIRIPLRGEEAVITTEAVVTREVVIGREVRTEERQVVGTVRSTEITVDEQVDEDYARLRPTFEAHFAERQRAAHGEGTTVRARDFRDAEPNYRAGFAAGRSTRYAGRSFDEAEPELLGQAGPSERDPGMLDQLRQEVREGFSRARTGAMH